jgi:hypothetical protein|tara:strand:- start:189 stop:1421 length:1233 start_codon:yes stop_codon:yes gene_type:complete
MYKLIKILLTNIFILLFFTSIVNSKIIYVEKQVTGIGENYKMALRDAIKEAISQVNGLTQETSSIIKTIEKTITDNEGDDNFSSTDFQENIKEKSKGSVKSYEILRQGKNLDGFIEVEIKAVIAKFALSKDAKRKRIAVLPLRQTIDSSSVDPIKASRMLNQSLTNYLVQTRKFTVLDRDFDEEVFSELDSLSDSANIEDQAKIGQKLFADYILVGRLEAFDIQETEKKYLTSDVIKKIKTGIIDFNYRIIDVPTKQIKYASKIREEINLKKQSQPMAFFIEQSSLKIGQEILYAIYPILIEKIKGDIAYLGQGGMQIEIGDIYDIYEMSDEVIKDSRTGEKLGKMEFKVGEAEIIDKNAKFSIAKINSNDDLSENFKPVKYYVKPSKEQKKEEKTSKKKKKKKKIDEVF